MTGITAARTLQASGIKDFIVLEGSGRVGGRVRNTQLGDYTVEEGALWVHGGVENPLYNLTQLVNTSLEMSDYDDYIARNGKGEDVTDALDEAYEGFDPARFREISGRDLPNDKIVFLQGIGMIEELPNGKLRATPKGFLVLDAVVADLASEAPEFRPVSD